MEFCWFVVDWLSATSLATALSSFPWDLASTVCMCLYASMWEASRGMCFCKCGLNYFYALITRRAIQSLGNEIGGSFKMFRMFGHWHLA